MKECAEEVSAKLDVTSQQEMDRLPCLKKRLAQ